MPARRRRTPRRKPAGPAIDPRVVSGTISEDEATILRAQEAVRRFRAMAPSLTTYARAVTKRHDVRVQVHAGVPCTDGKTIYMRPPIKLGDRIAHDKSICTVRDDDGVLVCAACRTRENVDITIRHEIAHICFDSFAEMSDAEKREVLDLALKEAGADDGSTRASKIRHRLDVMAPKTYVEANGCISPFLPGIFNALEDARVNVAMYRARPGTYKMFRAQAVEVFQEGMEAADGSWKAWSDLPEDAQVVIGLYAKASGLTYSEYFSDRVVEALNDGELTTHIQTVQNAKSARTIYKTGFPILETLRKHGFCLSDDDPEDDVPEGASEDCDDGESGDESDSEPSERTGTPDNEDTGGDDDEEGDGESGESDEADADDDEEGDGASGEPDDEEGDADDDGAPGESSDDDADDADDDSTDGSSADSDDESDDDGSDGADDDADAEDGGSSGADGTEDDDTGDDDDTETDDTDSDDESNGAPGDGDGADGDGDEDDEDEGDDGSGDSSSDEDDWGSDDDDSDPDWDDEDDDFDGDEDDDDGASISGDGDAADDASDRASEAERALEAFGGHMNFGTPRPTGDAGPSTAMTDPDEEREPEEVTDEMREIDRAIIQGEYFDAPTRSVYGVNLWQDNDRKAPGWGTYEIDDVIETPESILAPALQSMRVVFSDNKKARYQRNLKSGRIAARDLGKRAPIQDPRIFQKKREPAKKDYFVVIGMDISGSTAGSRIEMLKAAAYAQAELLHRAGINFAVYAHTGTSRDYDYTLHQHICDLDIHVIKAPKEKWDQRTKTRLRTIYSAMANLDGHTLEFYRKVAERERATDKIILYYTDGAMPCENFDDELEVLQREIRDAPRRNITIVGIGIKTDAPVEHGLDTIRIDSLEEVPRVIKDLESRLAKEVTP